MPDDFRTPVYIGTAMNFDYKGARDAGYSDFEIAQALAGSKGFDLDGALKAGYRTEDVLGLLLGDTQERNAAGVPIASKTPQYDEFGADVTPEAPQPKRNIGRENSVMRDMDGTKAQPLDQAAMAMPSVEKVSSPVYAYERAKDANRQWLDDRKPFVIDQLSRDKNLAPEDAAIEFERMRSAGVIPQATETGLREATWGEAARSSLNRVGPSFDRAVAGLASAQADLTGDYALAHNADGLRQQANRELAAAQGEMGGTESGTWKNTVANIAPSLAQNLPGLVLTAATRNPMYANVGLAGMFGSTFGDSYSEGKDIGLNASNNAQQSLLKAVAEVGPEKLSLNSMMRVLGKVPAPAEMKAGLAPLLKEVLAQQGVEHSTEQMTTAMQAAVDKLYTNPDLTLGDWAEQAAETFKATLIQAPLLSGSAILTSAGVKAAKRAYDPVGAELTGLNQEIEASQFRDLGSMGADTAETTAARDSAILRWNAGFGGQAAPAQADAATIHAAISSAPDASTAIQSALDLASAPIPDIPMPTVSPAPAAFDSELLALEQEAGAMDTAALVSGIEATSTPTGNLLVTGKNAADAVASLVPGAKYLTRKDGSVLVAATQAAAVAQAITNAKVTVNPPVISAQEAQAYPASPMPDTMSASIDNGDGNNDFLHQGERTTQATGDAGGLALERHHAAVLFGAVGGGSRIVTPRQSALRDNVPSGQRQTDLRGQAGVELGGLVGAISGREVVFFEGGAQPTDGFAIDSDRRFLYLNADQSVTPLSTAVHEVAHTMRRDAPEAYNGFTAGVQNVVDTSDAALLDFAQKYAPSQFRSALVKQRKASGETDTEILNDLLETSSLQGRDGLLEEFHSDLLGRASEHADTWRLISEEMARQDPGVLKQFLRQIETLAKRIREAFSGKSGFKHMDRFVLGEDAVTLAKNLETIRKEAARALAQYATLTAEQRQAKFDTRNPGVVRNSTARETAAQETENREGVIVGARPGEFDWTFASGGTPAPIQHPVQLSPRVEKLGPAVQKILSSKATQQLIADAFGVTNLQVLPTLGSYKGKPEPSFVLYGEGMSFEAADGISRMLGFAFAQEATIVTQPVHGNDEDTWPAFYVGSGKKLTKAQIDKVRNAAAERKLDYTTSVDGTAVKFFFDGSDIDAFMGKVVEIAKDAGLPKVEQVRTRSTFNAAETYLAGGAGSTERQVWYQEGGPGPSSLFGRTVDHLLVPYAKAVGAEGYRFSPDLFADRFGLDPQQREYIRAALRPKNGAKLSTADIVAGREALEVTKSDTRAKTPRSNNTDIMWALQNRAAKNGQIEPGDYSDAAKKAISQAIADEVVEHLSRPEGKSAIGWYDAALKRAKEIYDRVFPELRTDRDQEMLFDALLGIASQGNDVHSNSVFAGRMYYLITRENMTISQAVEALYGTFGGETRAIENNFLKFEELIDRNGYAHMRQLFNKKMTVGEWNAQLRRDETLFYKGAPLKVEGAARQVVNGWMVFGPKIGSFINNLHGDYSTLTADLWFSRTWNRILGFSFLHTPLQEAAKYQAFKEALIAEHTKMPEPRAFTRDGKPKYWEHGQDIEFTDAELDALLADPDAMLALATELNDWYKNGFTFSHDKADKKNGYSTKSSLRRAAKTWIEHREDSVAAPRSDNERAFQQETVEAAQRIIKRKTGEEITIADIQAALWYHEKELFQLFGAGDKKAEPADYADAAKNFMERYDNGDLFYVEKPSPRYIRGGKGDYLGGARFSPTRTGSAGDSQQAGAPDAGVPPTFGRGRRDAVQVRGVHFSGQTRQALNTALYGTGLKGAERERLFDPKNADIRPRSFFYVNEGQGVFPEAGVGAQAHDVDLANLYDLKADPLGYRKLSEGDSSKMERLIMQGGFDGFYAPGVFGRQGVAAVLGSHSIPVRNLGLNYRGGDVQPQAKAAPAPENPILADRTLPVGSVTGAKWKVLLAGRVEGLENLDDNQRYYKDEVVRALGARLSPARLAPNGKPSKLNEKQYAQVRTPQFKAWFGDWEKYATQPGGVWNDANGEVSKVVDPETGEPQVVYHGSERAGFTVLDPNKGDKHRSPMVFTAATRETSRSYAATAKEADLNSGLRVMERDGRFYVDRGDKVAFGYGDGFDTWEEANAEVDSYGGDDIAEEPGIYSLFLNIRNPYEADFEGGNWDGAGPDGKYEVFDGTGDQVYGAKGARYFDLSEAEQLAEENNGDYRDATGSGLSTNTIAEEAKRYGTDGAIIRQVVDDGGQGGYVEADDVFVIFDANQAKSATQNIGTFSKLNDDLRFSPARLVVDRFRGMAENPDNFSLKKSGEKDISQLITAMTGGLVGSKLAAWTTTDMMNKPVIYIGPVLGQNTKPRRDMTIHRINSERPYVTIFPDRQSARGAQLYQVAMAWAHNNGKTLVPDGEGLLPLNYLRRSEAMISSMLRFGTSRHVDPDDMQYIGLLSKEEYDQHLAMDEKSDVPEATLNLIPKEIKEKLAQLRKQYWLDESKADDVSLTYEQNLYWLMRSAATLASWRDPFINQLAVGTDGELYGPGGKKLSDTEARPGAELAARTGVGLATRYRAGLFWSLEEAAQRGTLDNLSDLPAEPGLRSLGTPRAGLLPAGSRWSVESASSASVLSGAMPDALVESTAFYSPARTAGATGGEEVRSGVTQSRAFKQWFGGSKVVDEDGKPKVMYHSTSVWTSADGKRALGDFSVFNRNASVDVARRPVSLDTVGSWFSDIPAVSEQYGNGATYPVFLSIQKPWVTTFEALARTANRILRKSQGTPVGKEGVDALRDWMQKAGYDGINLQHDDGAANGSMEFKDQDVWVALEPTQIKSAIGNNGDFDPTNPDIRYSQPRNLAGQPIAKTWTASGVTGYDNIVRKLQDKLVDTKRVVELIKEANVQLGVQFDPYAQETLFHGRAAKRVQDFADLELKPLLNEMRLAKVRLEELETYLWAKHAAERNAQVAKINPGMPDGGSGLTNAEARQILLGNPVQKNGATLQIDAAKQRQYDRLARAARAISDKTLDTLVAYGLETQATVDGWRKTYPNYVPLMRDLEADDNFLGAFNLGLGTGQGFSVRGPASKRAMGSERDVIDILANLAMQRERAITRGEKNRVAQAVYGAALKAPNPDFWLAINPQAPQQKLQAVVAELIQLGLNPLDAQAIALQPKQRYVDPETGMVTERINPALRGREDVLAVRVNGEDRFVMFSSNERAQMMVRNLKNLDAEQLGFFMQKTAGVTRWFAAVNTQYNPVFGLVNGVRDFQSAMLNLSSTPLAGQYKKVAAFGAQALAGIYRDLRDHRAGKVATSAWAAEFEEFAKAGGMTGFRDMFQNSKQRTDALADALKELSLGKVTRFAVISEANPIFAWLADYNTSIENAFRVAAYKAGKESGLSPDEAAVLAKNLTVNFNKKGLAATQAGALYAFFNAAVQGTSRIAGTMLEHQGSSSDWKNLRITKAGKTILFGGMVLGVMQGVMAALAGWDDEEPPQFSREKNFLIPVPGSDKVITIPYPLGFHVIPNLGRVSTEFVLSGFREPGKHGTRLLGMISDAFNPVGSSSNLMQTVLPTALDPAAALSANQDWNGRKIYKEDYNRLHPTPGWTRAKDTATPWAKAMAYGINWITGAFGPYESGLVSPTPDQIDFLIGQVTGGVGRELSKASQTVASAVTGEELPLFKIPVVGRFISETDGVSSQVSKMYRNLERVGAHHDPLNRMREEGVDTSAYLAEHPEATLTKDADRVTRRIGDLNKQKRNAVTAGDKDRVKAIEAQIKTTASLFNSKVQSRTKAAEGED